MSGGAPRRLIALVCAALLLEALLFGALSPLLPLLKEELNLSAGQAGVLVSMLPLGFMSAAIPAARCSLRFGERTTVLLGLGVLAGTSAAFGLADAFPALLVSRLLQGAGCAGAFSGGMTWLIHAVPSARRGAIVGLGMSAAAAGNICGPAVGAAASATSRTIVFVAVATFAAGLCLAATRLPRHRGHVPQPLRLGVALRDRGMRIAVVITAIPAALVGVMLVLAPLRLDRVGLGTTAIAVAFMLSALTGVMLRPAVGRWSDRRGRLLPIRVGLLATAPAMLLLGVVTMPWAAALLTAAALGVVGLCAAPAMALLADRCELLGLGQASGVAINILTWTAATIVGSIAAGALDDAAGSAAALTVAVGASLAALAACEQAARRSRRLSTSCA